MRRFRRDEHGTLSAEFVALIPILTVLLAIGWQLLVIVAAGNSTAQAARNASRSLATPNADIAVTVAESLPGWLRDEVEFEVSGSRVTVEVEVPLLFPATGVRPFTLERSAELPRG